jgi:hypothetical protein
VGRQRQLRSDRGKWLMQTKQAEKKISAIVEFTKFLFSFLKVTPIKRIKGSTRLIMDIRNREKEVLIKFIINVNRRFPVSSDLTCMS